MQTAIPKLYIYRKKRLMENNGTIESRRMLAEIALSTPRMGVVFDVEPHNINRYPAITGEYGVTFNGFGGYRIPLTHFREYFRGIRFRAAGNGKNVVCGYIVDNRGEIESIAYMADDELGNTTLPLTRNSHTLYASVPTKKGKPLWSEITVELCIIEPYNLRAETCDEGPN